MPELPEVELVARSLDRLVSGRSIMSARLSRPRLAPETTPRRFAKFLRGARILRVTRRGKHVICELEGGAFLITHLRMTGRFMLLPAGRAEPAHTHAQFRSTTAAASPSRSAPLRD
jgi:formamidopyrimidine-DNA glycosylase